MYRQGDLLIVPDRIPEKARREEDNVVELGEATGHAHVLEGGEVFSYGRKYLRSAGAAQLVHDEHDTIVLPEGEYMVVRQREHVADGVWNDVSD